MPASPSSNDLGVDLVSLEDPTKLRSFPNATRRRCDYQPEACITHTLALGLVAMTLGLMMLISGTSSQGPSSQPPLIGFLRSISRQAYQIRILSRYLTAVGHACYSSRAPSAAVSTWS